jgi:hypothetical protein
MALRSVATTDTLGTFRTTFNTLATDVGDLSNLETSNVTSLVDAVNEVLNTSFSFTLRDSTSSIQAISQNDVLNVVGDSNISVTVSSTDTLNVTLQSNITGLASVSATTISGTTITGTTIDGGVVRLNSNQIKTIDSSSLLLQNNILISNSNSITGINNLSGAGTVNFTTDVQVNSVSVATKPFAIAQAIALGG